MIQSRENGLKSSLRVKNQDSLSKYMNYGLSGLIENNEKENPLENVTAKIKESEERVDGILGIIENMFIDKNAKKKNNNKGAKRQSQKNLRKKCNTKTN